MNKYKEAKYFLGFSGQEVVSFVEPQQKSDLEAKKSFQLHST